MISQSYRTISSIIIVALPVKLPTKSTAYPTGIYLIPLSVFVFAFHLDMVVGLGNLYRHDLGLVIQ